MFYRLPKLPDYLEWRWVIHKRGLDRLIKPAIDRRVKVATVGELDKLRTEQPSSTA